MDRRQQVYFDRHEWDEKFANDICTLVDSALGYNVHK